VDLDPLAAGVQSTRSVALDAVLTVHVVIAGVDAGSPLNGFELDLGVDPTRLAALGASLGDFLPLPRLLIESDVTPPDVNVAAVSIGPVGGAGDGVLAVVTLRADAPGAALLALDDVVLSAPFGVPIGVGALQAATLTVVPEAGSAACLALGAALLGCRRRRRAHSTR
jgi:hypothetical protein